MIECRFEKDRPYVDPPTGKYEIYRLTLRPGDAYIMSEWAAGITWRTEAKSKVTIRHRAGTQAFLIGSAERSSFLRGQCTRSTLSRWKISTIFGPSTTPTVQRWSLVARARNTRRKIEMGRRGDRNLTPRSMALYGGHSAAPKTRQRSVKIRKKAKVVLSSDIKSINLGKSSGELIKNIRE